MVTLRGPSRRRVMIDDARGGGTFVRLTWHAEADVFVLSHWEGSVCRAASRISPEDAVGMIAVLADGLEERGHPVPGWPLPVAADRRAEPGLRPAVSG